MPLVLTPEQSAQIDPKRVTDDRLPQIYNKETGEDQPISRDFEAVLITLGKGTAQSAVAWANALADYQPSQDALRAVMAQYLDVQYDSLAQRVVESLDGLDDFDAIKSGLGKLSVAGAATVPEITTMVNDMSFLLGEHTEKSDLAIHGLIVNRMAYANLIEGKDAEGVKRELRSFAAALLSY